MDDEGSKQNIFIRFLFKMINTDKKYHTTGQLSHQSSIVKSRRGKRTTFPPTKLLAPKECCAHIEAGSEQLAEFSCFDAIERVNMNVRAWARLDDERFFSNLEKCDACFLGFRCSDVAFRPLVSNH